MNSAEITRAAERIREHARPLTNRGSELDALVRAVGDARYVLLGEASHGTHEFYALRAALSRRLIEEKGFSIVAVEADWPDAYRVNRFVRGAGRDPDARDALASFERFPTWMWRNEVVHDFVSFLREHNRGSRRACGFYGIDLYSLHSSISAVLSYLERTDAQAARDARERYSCFDSFGSDPERYGYATSFGYLPSCEEAVIEQLTELNEQRARLLESEGFDAADELFFAAQNARVVKNAEQYYRAMHRGGISSWNLRDTHMADTVDVLVEHFSARDHGSPSSSSRAQTVNEQQPSRADGPAKVIVWAHNSHLGDARATELGQQGELNVGQLLRERHPRETFVLGFSTYEGSVIAATDWDGPAERQRVRPALSDSGEALLHAVGLPAFLLLLDEKPVREVLDQPRLQRAIGVIYRPDSERVSHYYETRVAGQFDALIHIDQTRALVPLGGDDREQGDELPETYPTGL